MSWQVRGKLPTHLHEGVRVVQVLLGALVACRVPVNLRGGGGGSSGFRVLGLRAAHNPSNQRGGPFGCLCVCV